MTYKEAEQRLKELLKTGFLVAVEFEEDLSLKVEKLLHSLYSKDNNLFQVGAVWEDGVFEEDGFDDTWFAGMWNYFGIVNGVTYVSDELYLTPSIAMQPITVQELEEIVTAFVNGNENTTESKFEAVFGDQSLFDLVEATDEHLYMILNKRHTGIYALTQEEKDCAVYNDSVVLAERKLKEPEFIPYQTDTYSSEQTNTSVNAFRSIGLLTCIGVQSHEHHSCLMLDKESTIRFANELIAIANGVERKE